MPIAEATDDNGSNKVLEKENVFLFIPNLIGYTRLVLATVSLYYMPLHPRTCSLLYSASCILDAADGIAARRYNQSTTFGAVLDMITDRCTTACLHVFLATAYPRWAVVFQGFISLDLASHYAHMYAVLALGSGERSHKQVDARRSRILHMYYTNKTFLFLLCAFNEIFFIALYLLSFSNSPLSTVLITTPHSAGEFELARANKMSSRTPLLLAKLSFPLMMLKQYINVVQLITACKWLGEGDVAARRRNGIAALKQRQNEQKAH